MPETKTIGNSIRSVLVHCIYATNHICVTNLVFIICGEWNSGTIRTIYQ